MLAPSIRPCVRQSQRSLVRRLPRGSPQPPRWFPHEPLLHRRPAPNNAPQASRRAKPGSGPRPPRTAQRRTTITQPRRSGGTGRPTWGNQQGSPTNPLLHRPAQHQRAPGLPPGKARLRPPAAAHSTTKKPTTPRYHPPTTPKWRNWQTRRTQNPVPLGECGFDSHLRHSRRQAVSGRLSSPWLALRRRPISMGFEQTGVREVGLRS
jgi:hypothetical protein